MSLLLIMAAAAAASSYAGTQQAGYATNVQQSQLDLQMQANVLNSNEQAIANTRALRESLATQMVLSAARGGTAGQGSSRAGMQESVGNYLRDEEARKLSLGFAKAQTDLAKSLLDVQYQGTKTKDLFNLGTKLGGGFQTSSAGGSNTDIFKAFSSGLTSLG